MSIIDKLKGMVGKGESRPNSKKRFTCHGCDSEFDSFKLEERASCPECLSNDVEVVTEL